MAFFSTSIFSLLTLAFFTIYTASASDVTQTAVSNKLSIGVVVFDKTANLDSVGPMMYLELLSMAGKNVSVVTVSSRAGRTLPESQLPLHATTTFNQAPTTFDIFLIPGGGGVEDVMANPPFMDYIARTAGASTIVMSVCTGANILASTGLLNGRNATTNKLKFRRIAAKHPQVNWVRHARWVVDGKFWTSSGVSAGMDMGNAFVVEKYGAEVGAKIVRTLETVPITDPNNDPWESSIDLQ